jgi:hypothetical protein
MKTAIHALDIPHPAHEIPVRNLIGHVMPKPSKTRYNNTTTAIAETI